ncbi:MAG: hypothetical protein FWF77_04225 [Defluviitaleaceae bacterium]|nr:hypothetical protein [Defluviitaleaceae bacterium]
MSAATHALEAGSNFPAHKKRVGECHSPTLFLQNQKSPHCAHNPTNYVLKNNAVMLYFYKRGEKNEN